MNNLKKVLALGLALVMLLGMFTIASAAKDEKMVASDLTDWSSVEHKDAVALMVDLGIIKGLPDGSFDPNGNIDRASWAKMVYFAATGSDDADAYLGTSTNLKDISGNWAESYISYLSSNSYISGDNFGNYNPSNNVTVAEACKMMLTVLGYDAEDRGYQNNAAWSGNIMTDAKRNGLMNNVDRTQTALVALTRENAAEIIYNALQANTVEAEPQWDAGNKYITKYNKVAYLGYEVFGIVKVDVKLDSVDSNGYGMFTGKMQINDTDTGINASTLNGKVRASMDVAGEIVSLFIEATNAKFDDKTGEISASSINYKAAVSSTVARNATGADAVFTGGFKWADLTDASSDDYVASAWPGADTTSATGYVDRATFYINGAKISNTETPWNTIQGWTYDTTADSDFRKLAGTVVEFYLGDEGEISTVKAYHYTVTQLEGDAETRTSGGKLQVRVPGIPGLSSWTDADRVSGYQGLAEEDVVLWYRDTNVNAEAKYVIEKAEMVTGKVTNANSSKAITVNGTKYKRTAPQAMENTLTPDGQVSDRTDFSKWNANDRDIEFNFYLDKNGTVCFTEQVSDSVNKGNVALILAAEWTGTDMATASGLLQAKLLFIDGTTDIVTVSKIDMDGNGLKQIVTTKSTVESTAARQIIGGPKTNAVKVTTGEEGQAITLLADAKIGTEGAAFFNYKVVDGKYELTKVIAGDPKNEDDWTATRSANHVAIDKVADFTKSEGSFFSANSRTTFVVAKGEAEEKQFYTYTSVKNVPATKDAYVLAVGTYDAPNAARYVYIDTEAYIDDVPDGYKFIYTNNWDEDADNDDCYLVEVVDESGKQVSVSMTTSLWGEMSKDSNKFSAMNPADNKNAWVGKFVKVGTVDEKGVISELDETGIVLGDIAVLGDDVVQVEGEKAYLTDNLTKFVYVDLRMDDGDDLTTDADDTLVYAGSNEFKPNGFYRPATVGEPAADANGHILMSNATTTYRSVKMVVIPSTDDTVADFVYVVRVCW